jgi:hypothetical protein
MPQDLHERIQVSTYGDLMARDWLPAANYIFADIERLKPAAAARAARLWEVLAESGYPVRLFNHPTRSCRRYQLLRRLFHLGINTFNVHRADEAPTAIRYPVFLRGAHDHNGARTDLIRDPVELEGELCRVQAEGLPLERILIVEFCDTRDEHGIFRKYDAYVGGDRILATDVYFSKQWMLKWNSNRIFDGIPVREEDLDVEEIEYFRNFAGHEQLRKACAAASIDYGRVDFSWLGDRIQVWEINTNPDLALPRVLTEESADTPYRRHVLPHLLEAVFEMFRSMDSELDPGVRIPLDPARLAQ